MKVAVKEETSLREDAINGKFALDKNYRPYTEDIYIGNNKYSFGKFRKKVQSKDSLFFALTVGLKEAHIWYDGVENPNGTTLCIEKEQDIAIVDLDFMNDLEDADLKTVSNYACDIIPQLTVN